ncbi:MAG: DUF3048 domain-containing protein [Candidatus Dormibacteraeota bacterium]|nr:DUF3048 domain-containing protein [Candidatus Dormibacteraeota bacterium]
MPNCHRSTQLLALAAVVAAAVAACGGSSAGSTPTPTPKPTPTAPPPLAAPWIVQVENQADARPQAGLSTADVVYEYETEGGISRFSALFFQTPTAMVGPIRSARLVTIKLVQAYKGTLLYSGGSTYVVQQLGSSGVRQYDETSAEGALFRVNSRAAPHNLYTDGSHLTPLAQKVGAQTVDYHLWARTPQTTLPKGGTPMPKFSVPVSDSENPVYTYDTATGGYQRTEPDTGVLNDNDTQAPWEAKTIVVLPVSVTIAPEVEDVSGAHGLDFALVSGGPGQIAIGGQVFPINFGQSPTGPPQLTLSNGTAAPLAPGQVLIELVATGKTIQPAA